MIPTFWLGKPYYSLDAYCKQTFRHKCYKIALNAHMTCPNRDGSLDTRGCIFCSAGGSGDFAVDMAGKSVTEQISEGLSFFGDKKVGNSFIAYFQAYTNTYAPLPYLRQVFTEALDCPDVCGISIATRPDCLGDEVLDLLSDLKNTYPDKFIWVELGLQTANDAVAAHIRRGYATSVYDDAAARLSERGIPHIAHVIVGLPDETKDDLLATIAHLNRVKPFGIKLQLLHILKGTDLAAEYEKGLVTPLTRESYLDLVVTALNHLDPDIVVHRVTGDGPGDLLIAPTFSLNKRDVLNSLHAKMRLENAFQGRDFVRE